MAKFAWSDYERAMLVSLDSRKRVRAAVWLREGTTDRVSLDIKDVVSAAIKGGTDTVVLSHNHPNGVPLPSREDLAATENMPAAGHPWGRRTTPDGIFPLPQKALLSKTTISCISRSHYTTIIL